VAKRAAVLKGAKIAVDAPNTIVHGYVRYAARAAGLDPDRDVTVSPMQPPAMLQALKSGQVDGFAMSRPWASMVRRDGTAVLLASSPQGDFPEINPFGYNLIITRPGVCEAKPTTCRKLLAGLKKALEMMHDQPAEALAVLKKRFEKTDPDLVEDAFKGVMAGTPRTPEVKEAGLANAQQYMLKAGQIKTEEMLKSFAGIYTNEYAK
jgi:ABC-type nitrate/sulfonate/bicarbonate transport system substrate-binding protein